MRPAINDVGVNVQLGVGPVVRQILESAGTQDPSIRNLLGQLTTKDPQFLNSDEQVIKSESIRQW